MSQVKVQVQVLGEQSGSHATLMDDFGPQQVLLASSLCGEAPQAPSNI